MSLIASLHCVIICIAKVGQKWAKLSGATQTKGPRMTGEDRVPLLEMEDWSLRTVGADPIVTLGHKTKALRGQNAPDSAAG